MTTGSDPKPHRSSGSLAVAALILAVLAVVLSMGGWSLAGLPKDEKSEVTVLTVATGSFTTPADGGELPLSNASYTQEAGTSIIAIVSLGGEIPPLQGDDVACSFTVFVGTSEAFGVHVDRTNGGLHDNSAVEGIPSGDVAVERTMEAFITPDCDTDGVTVELTVEILGLR